MQNTAILTALVVSLLPLFSFAQKYESPSPTEYFLVSHPEMAKWEAYFREKYGRWGHLPDTMLKGSGYLPYLRLKYLYDLRKDYQGETGGLKRWEVFRQICSKSLERDSASPAANWQNIGPNTMEGQAGRMISHAFEPGNSQVLWAGSASGGLWLTENGGDSWQAMTDQIPSTGVGAVAVNPLNPNSILIGTGEGYAIGVAIRPGLGVFKSTDRGLMWTSTEFEYTQSAGVSVFSIVWNYADTNVVWLGTTNGIWKSTDAGLSWTLKKGDGTNQLNSICNDLALHPTNPNLIYAAVESDGIWRSNDGGDSWEKLSGGLPSTDLNLIRIDLCRDQPNVLYASMASGQASGFGLRGLYRSNNGGDSWAQIQNAPNALCQPGNPNACQGWYDNVVAVSPVDPDMVWLGGITLWRSEDGGQNWLQRDRLTCPNCSEPPACRTYVDQHDLAFDPQNPQVVYVFNDGGVAKSNDGGICFTHQNEGLITAQLYTIASGRSDPGTIITGTQDHGLQGIKLSENTNHAWDRWGFLDGSEVEVHGSNANILYGTLVDGKYMRTNGGVHALAAQINNGINLAENSGFFFPPLRKHPQSHFTLLGATQQRLYKTTNGGNLWTPVASMNQARVLEFDQADPNFAYASVWSQNGTSSFWRSENGGDTWNTTASPGWRVTDIKSSPAQAGLLYASRNSNFPNVAHILKSSNFGNSWTPIQGDLPDLPVNAIAVHPFAAGVLFAATDLGVFITTDEGLHWTAYNHNLPITFATDMVFNPVDTSLLIATLGRGAWRTKAWMPEESSNAVEPQYPGFGFVNLSPNPATESVRIVYFLPNAATTKIEVLNVLGQPVASLLSGWQGQGEHFIHWDGRCNNGRRAESGLYFIRISAHGKAVSKSFSLLKQ